MAGSLVDSLQQIELFASLDAEGLQTIAEVMQEQVIPPGTTITAEGAVSDGFFLIEAGEASVDVQGETRGTMGPGDHFGEIALLMGAERTATVTAISEMRCLCLSGEDFRDIVEGSPEIAWALMGSMTQRLD